MPITSVYNFIPAPVEKEVFKPSWAKHVSHDVPFEDGESGEIELKITAQTPIFIRNGHTKQDAKIFEEVRLKKHRNPNYVCSTRENEAIDQYLSFSRFPDGQYFIPATSLKGMIRNVLEIMSFSRLNPDLVDDRRFAHRDLSNQAYREEITKDVKAGWLFVENGFWQINEVDFFHIHHINVDAAKGSQFRESFLNQQPIDKTAKWKYNSITTDLQLKFNVEEGEYNRLAIPNENGQYEGQLVFTGQPGMRTEPAGEDPRGKVHEFVFTNPAENQTPLQVYELVKKDFLFTYADQEKNSISPDWEYMKEKLYAGERIPVFFHKNEENTVTHFGLSYMYKLPYKYRLFDLNPFNSYKEKKNADLATCIFGSVENTDSLINNVQALKGRVFFGHALAEKACPFPDYEKEILSSPKASFYPFYKGTDYDSNSSLKGFKKYPVHEETWSDRENIINDNLSTSFIPLEAGSVFISKVRFHNLKKIEIGALISALTFHNNSTRFSHSIGGAKPYGYGKISVQISNINHLQHDEKEYLEAFEYAMNNHTKKVLRTWWNESPQIQAFLKMSHIPQNVSHELRYHELADFAVIKNNGQRLYSYSNDPVDLYSFNVEKIEKEIAYFEGIMSDNKALQEFAIDYPNSFLTSEVGQLIIKNKNKEIQARIKDDSDSIELLREFIKHNPNSSIKKELEDRIKKLEQIEVENTYTNISLSILSKDKLEKIREEVSARKNNYPKSEKLVQVITKVNEQIQKLEREEQRSNIPWSGETFSEIFDCLKEYSKLMNIGTFPKNQVQEIMIKIEESFGNEISNKNSRLLKRGKLVRPTKYPWSTFIGWIGSEKTEELYNKFKKLYEAKNS